MSLNEKEREFIIGLNELTKKTGIAVGGCGCCGSPYLHEIDSEDISNGAGYGDNGKSDISWISPADHYDWKLYKTTIYK